MIDLLIDAMWFVLFACFFFFIGIAMTDCFGLKTGIVSLVIFTAWVGAFLVWIKTDGFNEPLLNNQKQVDK